MLDRFVRSVALQNTITRPNRTASGRDTTRNTIRKSRRCTLGAGRRSVARAPRPDGSGRILREAKRIRSHKAPNPRLGQSETPAFEKRALSLSLYSILERERVDVLSLSLSSVCCQDVGGCVDVPRGGYRGGQHRLESGGPGGKRQGERPASPADVRFGVGFETRRVISLLSRFRSLSVEGIKTIKSFFSREAPACAKELSLSLSLHESEMRVSGCARGQVTCFTVYSGENFDYGLSDGKASLPRRVSILCSWFSLSLKK